MSKKKAEAKLSAVDEAKKPKQHGSTAAKILVETYWDDPKEATQETLSQQPTLMTRSVTLSMS